MANKKMKMTQKECLTAAIAALYETGNDAAATRAEEWLAQLNKPRDKKTTKDSGTIKRENRAIEVAKWINDNGKPVVVADLIANLDGWSISSETGKVVPQSVSGCMRTALRMNLVKADKKGKGKAIRYLPLDYVEVEEMEETEVEEVEE